MREGYKESSVGVIPEDWHCTKLKKVIKDFIVPMRDKPKKFSGDIPWCRIEDFNGIYLSESKSGQCVDQNTVDHMNLKVYPVGTVLVSCSAYLGRCAIVEKPLITNQTFIGLNPSSETLSEFIYYMMGFNERKLNLLSSGTTIAYLSRVQFENFYIPIPPLPEQEKIASILITVDDKIESIDKQIESATELKKGLMQKLFQEGIGHTEFKDSPVGKIPAEWEVKKLNEVFEIARGGSPRPIKDYITEGDGYNWIKIGDIKKGDKYVYKTKEKIRKEGLNKTVLVNENDFILSNSMSFGRPYIVKITGCIHDGWLLLRNSKKLVDINFMYYFLSSDIIMSQFKSRAAGSTVNNLNIQLVQSVTSILPSLDEQKQIADILTCADDKISVLKEKKEAYTELKKGLMQKLLTGEVRVKVDA